MTLAPKLLKTVVYGYLKGLVIILAMNAGEEIQCNIWNSPSVSFYIVYIA